MLRGGFRHVEWDALVRVLFLVGLVSAFTLLEPRFLGALNLLNVLRQAAILALVAFGQTLVIASGGIDISCGALVALVSVVTALVTQTVGIPVAVAAGLLCGLAAGLVSGVSVAYLRVQPVVATLGALLSFRALAFILSGGQPVVGLPPVFAWLGSIGWGLVPFPALLALAALLIGQGFLNHHRAGRELLAIGSSPETARSAGINVERGRMLAYALSGVGTALTALVLTSRFLSGQPTAGQGLELEAITAVILGGTRMGGGVGSLWRTALGALILATLRGGMSLAGISPYLQLPALGVLLVLAAACGDLHRVADLLHRRPQVVKEVD